MLHEIGGVRQDSQRGHRRWFQDDFFDLYIWQDEHGTPVAFQLCYARGIAEAVISWTAGGGFDHASVDGGEKPLRHAMAPLLRPGGMLPYFTVYGRLLASTAGWDPQLRVFLLEHLRDYRRVLLGVPRRPRRRALRTPRACGPKGDPHR
ncbi:MAG: hypothetical protein EHM59_08850 [Betaproteobacteria bacterium]|nr:MAG: hypothetical protein EHM59_08850 [Betaproteobacteria bacterium]